MARMVINALLQDWRGKDLPRIAEMPLERASHTQAESYERTETRNGHAMASSPDPSRPLREVTNESRKHPPNCFL